MCVCPTLIKNPNYGYKGKYAFMKDCVSQYIKVPCGHCSECVHNRQMSITQRCQLESISGHPFFCTLTYNNQSLPQVACSDGRSIRYADCSDVTNMIKRLRNDDAFGRPFRYFVVSELGSKRARPHFHILFYIKKLDTDTIYTPINLEYILFKTVLSYWTRNYGSRRKPVYHPLCTYVSKYVCGKLKSTYDLHYVVPSTLDGSTMDVAYYVTKYMLKPNDKVTRLQRALHLNLPEDEYKDIWKLVKPRWFSSLNFGFGVYGMQVKNKSLSDRLSELESTQSFEYVKKSISRSRSSDYPCFFNPETGRSMPLSRYWKSFGNLYTVDDAIYFHRSNPRYREDNVSIDERSDTSKQLSVDTHRRQLSQIESHELNTDLLFE